MLIHTYCEQLKANSTASLNKALIPLNKIRTCGAVRRIGETVFARLFHGREKLAAKRRMKWGFLARREITVLTERR